MLSKPGEVQDQLFGLWSERGCAKRVVDPFPQVAVTKEIPTQERDQVGQRPPETGLELEILDQQDGDQCCPNLNSERIFTGSHEGLDFQILLDGLEEDFDLPTVPVNGGDGLGVQFALIGSSCARRKS